MNSNRQNTGPKSKLPKSSDALEVIDRNLIGDDAEMKALVDEAAFNAQIAQSIYEARKAADLSQKELAELVGTTPSVISQLENADYEGNSLSMLRKVAAALRLRLEMKLVPDTPEPQHV